MPIYCAGCPEVAEQESMSVIKGYTTQGLDTRDFAEGAYMLAPLSWTMPFRLHSLCTVSKVPILLLSFFQACPILVFTSIICVSSAKCIQNCCAAVSRQLPT